MWEPLTVTSVESGNFDNVLLLGSVTIIKVVLGVLLAAVVVARYLFQSPGIWVMVYDTDKHSR